MAQRHKVYQQGDALFFEMPTMFGMQTIVFTNEYMADGKRKIFYRDATKISYNAMHTTTNFIFTSQDYNFKVGSANHQIEVSMTTAFKIGNAERQEIWQRLVGIALHVIQPHIVENLMRRIFVNGETVDVHGLELTREGYALGKFLFWGRDQVLWTDACTPPTTWQAGKVIISGGKHRKHALWKVPVEEPNAVVLPELMNACVNAASRGYVPVSL